MISKELIKSFKLSLLDRQLVCVICDGYFRFAHTLSECGHTFCFSCIQKLINCPTCGILLSKTAVRKDPYMQNIVDILYPQFHNEEQIIINRIKQLFGDNIDEKYIQSLLEEKDHTLKKRKKYVKEEKSNLTMIIQQTLNGTTYEEFKNNIYDDRMFEKYLLMVSTNKQPLQQQVLMVPIVPMVPKAQAVQAAPKKAPEIQVVEQDVEHKLHLKGLTDIDQNIAKVQYTIIYKQKNNQSVFQRIKKHVFRQIKIQECVNNNLINAAEANAENVRLWHQGRVLNEDDPISKLYEQAVQEIVIRYEILFKL